MGNTVNLVDVLIAIKGAPHRVSVGAQLVTVKVMIVTIAPPGPLQTITPALVATIAQQGIMRQARGRLLADLARPDFSTELAPPGHHAARPNVPSEVIALPLQSLQLCALPALTATRRGSLPLHVLDNAPLVVGEMLVRSLLRAVVYAHQARIALLAQEV